MMKQNEINYEENNEIEENTLKKNMQIPENNLNRDVMNIKYKNTIKFWTSQYQAIMEETVVILYASEDLKIIKTAPSEILRQLIRLNLLVNLEALNMLTNKAFFYLRFDNATNAASFQNQTKSLNYTKINYLSYQEDNKDIIATIDGVPYTKIQKQIAVILEPFAHVTDITPTMLIFPDGQKVQTTPTKFKLKLKENITIEKIPNFIYFGQLRAFLWITGKPPVCFNCEQVNHLSKHCTLTYCKQCRKMVGLAHICKPSYADKLKISPLNIQHLLHEAALEQFPDLESQKNLEDDNDFKSDLEETDSSSSEALSNATLPYGNRPTQLDDLSDDTIPEQKKKREAQEQELLEHDIINLSSPNKNEHLKKRFKNEPDIKGKTSKEKPIDGQKEKKKKNHASSFKKEKKTSQLDSAGRLTITTKTINQDQNLLRTSQEYDEQFQENSLKIDDISMDSTNS